MNTRMMTNLQTTQQTQNNYQSDLILFFLGLHYLRKKYNLKPFFKNVLLNKMLHVIIEISTTSRHHSTSQWNVV